MNSISYRKWDFWLNQTIIDEFEHFNGFFECVLTPTLMSMQTVEFLYENFEFNLRDEYPERVKRGIDSTLRFAGDLKQYIINENNELCIKIRNNITRDEINSVNLNNILKQIENISLCVDFTLNCNKIVYKDYNKGIIFYATRRPLGRAVGFSPEERSVAFDKFQKDFVFLNNSNENKLKISVKHYLAGINLLGLEDQFPGLIEAAFMQFYLGCEILCETHKCEEAKKYISFLNISDKKELQIIAHQVWQVRNSYYGHGALKNNPSEGFEIASEVAKQVLVVRYLCRRLIDCLLPSDVYLVREIGLYPNGYSENFNGSVNELSNNFFVPYYGRVSKIYEDGIKIDDYEIKVKNE